MSPSFSPGFHSLARSPRRHRSPFLQLLRQLYRQGKPRSHPDPEQLRQPDLDSAFDDNQDIIS